MTAICDISLGWIYEELVKEIKILELLFDAEFLCAFFHVNFIFEYICINSQELKTQMCHKCVRSKIVYGGANIPNKPAYET